MKEFEIGEVIAERILRLLDTPGHDVRLLIGRPTLGDNQNDWYCPYQIVGIGDQIVRVGMGVDALQALQLVIDKAAPAWLTRLLGENPSLRWEDAEQGDFGF